MRTFHYHMDYLGLDIPTYSNLMRIIEVDREARARGVKLEGPWKDLPRTIMKLGVNNVDGMLTVNENVIDLRKVIANIYVDRGNKVFVETSEKKPRMNYIERPQATNWIASFYLDRSMDELYCITNSRMLYGDIYRVNLEFTSVEPVHFYCCHEEFYSANISFLRAFLEQRWMVPYNPTEWQFPVQENLGQLNVLDVVSLDPDKTKSLVVYGDGVSPVEIPFSISRFQRKIGYQINLDDFEIPRATYNCPYRLSPDRNSIIFTVKPPGRFNIEIIPKFTDRVFVERFVFPTTNLHLNISGVYVRRPSSEMRTDE